MSKVYYPSTWRTIGSILPGSLFLLLFLYATFFTELWYQFIFAILCAYWVWEELAGFSKTACARIEIHYDHLIIQHQRSKARRIEKSHIKEITIGVSRGQGRKVWIALLEEPTTFIVPNKNICSVEEMHGILSKWLKGG